MNRAFFDELAAAARASIKAELGRGLTAENKSSLSFDPVTNADRAAERAMRALIEQHYPEDAIWGEEFGWTREGADRVWSLDPVDGTRALICNLPSWSTLVGVVEEGCHVAGMIDIPALDESLIAVDGRTEVAGIGVKTSGCLTVPEARLSTTDPYLFEQAESERFERVRCAAAMTRYGLDALGYARVAMGDLDLVVESGLKRHDYDAVVAVVRGAGGHVGDWEGGNDFAPGRIVAAASRSLYDDAVVLLGA